MIAAPTSRLDQLKARKSKPGEASFFYHDHHFHQDAVKVLPGEYFVTADDMMVMTVLGSCIAACIVSMFSALTDWPALLSASTMPAKVRSRPTPTK